MKSTNVWRIYAENYIGAHFVPRPRQKFFCWDGETPKCETGSLYWYYTYIGIVLDDSLPMYGVIDVL